MYSVRHFERHNLRKFEIPSFSVNYPKHEILFLSVFSRGAGVRALQLFFFFCSMLKIAGFVLLGGYVFNTEAHPIDAAALYCCSSEKYRDDVELDRIQAGNNILATLNVTSLDDDVDKYFDEVDSTRNGRDSTGM